MQIPQKRSLPRALFHVTTERHWRQIQTSAVLLQGRGYGWEERQGVFALSWHNWVATGNLHYLSFLTLKLRGRHDKLVVARIEMTPALWDATRVALLSSGTPTSRLLVEKARSGCFSNISATDVVLLNSYEDTLVRNTFLLREFVREIPPASDPVEYIIEREIPTSLVTKIAEVHRLDIPDNIMRSGRRLARRMKRRQGANTPPKGKRPRALVTREDKQAFIALLLASRRRLSRASSR
ncbi:MAG TPA: hypothetical protein V6D17_11615 [Candidatus Obscuribacterales bacterium]